MAYSIISIYPILNFVVTNDFLNEFTYNVQELSLTYYMRGNIAINYATNYLHMSYIMQEKTDLIVKLDKYIQELNEENNRKLTSLALLEKDFIGVNRFGHEDY